MVLWNRGSVDTSPSPPAPRGRRPVSEEKGCQVQGPGGGVGQWGLQVFVTLGHPGTRPLPPQQRECEGGGGRIQGTPSGEEQSPRGA